MAIVAIVLGNNRRRVSFLLAVSSLVMLSACGSDSATNVATEPGDSSTMESTASTSASSVQWSAPLIGGGTYDLARTPLERPVALWFWAPG